MPAPVPPSAIPAINQATRLGRVGLVLEQLGLPTASPLALMSELGLGAGPIRIGLERAGRHVVVAGAWTDAADRARLSLELGDPALAPILRVLWPGPPGPSDQVQVLVDPDGTRLGAAAVGPRALADVRRLLASVPIAPGARDVALDVAEQVVALARADLAVTVVRWGADAATTLELELLTHAAPADRAGATRLALGIDQLAEDLGASMAQRQLVGRLGQDLGARGVGLGIGLIGGAVRLRIGLDVATWDLAVRVLAGLTLTGREVSETATRIGAFAGATGAAGPAAITLELGPHEPPAAWVWAEGADIAPRT
ncbi:MAG: hypothetical protein KBG28_11450 [Kofleriaceae bacterium]|nr:hypothetical protein [Kofleriaceae bacterium]